jgi:CubicO group peptidase (beta-lactamase class C family)
MPGMPLDAIDTWVGDGDVPAVAAAVVDRDGVRELRFAGDADERSLFALASLTKPLVAVAALVAAEEGAIDLDAPVADHLPSYHRPATEAITARHLLAHASGLPESAKGVEALEVEPAWPRASRRVYSNEGFHVLGALIAAATGIDHRTYVTEAVFQAGGLDARMPLLDADAARALEVREPGLSRPGVELFNDREWRRRGNAAGGAFATIGAYAEVVRWLLAASGPISAESHAELRSVQWPGLEGGLESFPKMHCPDWGLGVNVRGRGSPHWCGDAVSPSTLSHFGASGTLMWADLEAGLGLVCLANRGTYSGWMLRQGRWADLTRAVLAA